MERSAQDFARSLQDGQRAQEKTIVLLAREIGLTAPARFDLPTLTGVFRKLHEMLRSPGFVDDARMTGLAEVQCVGQTEARKEQERLRLHLQEEPVGELAALLAADFSRESGPQMRPIVFAGKGIADELSFLLPPGAKMKRRACCATPIADEPGVDQERDDEALYRAAVVSKQDGSIADEPVENLSQLVATVVASEGPISGSLLNDRIKSGFGVSSLRAGAAENLRVALKAAMAAGLVFETDPGFFQPAHCDVRVRNRRGQPEKVRALSNLPPSETRAGIIAEIVAEPLSEESADLRRREEAWLLHGALSV